MGRYVVECSDNSRSSSRHQQYNEKVAFLHPSGSVQCLRSEKAFVVDAARPTVTIAGTDSGHVTQHLNISTPSAGAVDTKVDGDYLYLLTDPVNSDLELVASPKVLLYGMKPAQREATSYTTGDSEL